MLPQLIVGLGCCWGEATETPQKIQPWRRNLHRLKTNSSGSGNSEHRCGHIRKTQTLHLQSIAACSTLIEQGQLHMSSFPISLSQEIFAKQLSGILCFPVFPFRRICDSKMRSQWYALPEGKLCLPPGAFHPALGSVIWHQFKPRTAKNHSCNC